MMDRRTIRTPLWDTDMMYEESLLMIRDGADVFKTIRKNPLPNRGNISKYT